MMLQVPSLECLMDFLQEINHGFRNCYRSTSMLHKNVLSLAQGKASSNGARESHSEDLLRRLREPSSLPCYHCFVLKSKPSICKCMISDGKGCALDFHRVPSSTRYKASLKSR